MKQMRIATNHQRVAGLIQLPVPEPMTPREEAIRFLASGMLELIIQRSRQPESPRLRREHWLRAQARNEN